MMNTLEKKIFEQRVPKRGNVVLQQSGDLLFVGGHGPEDTITGEPFYTGRLGNEVTEEEGYKAARICGILILSELEEYLGSLDNIDYLVKAFGLVSSEPDFYRQNQVMDGFSDLMVEVLGERGLHARSAMGTSNLPAGNIPVEVELIVKIKQGASTQKRNS